MGSVWDERRDAFLRSQNFEVLHFDNADINLRIEDVLDTIADRLDHRLFE